MSKIGKPIETESRIGFQGLWGKKVWGVTVSEYEVSFWGDEYVLKVDRGDGCTPLWIF